MREAAAAPDTVTALKCELAAEVLRASGKLRLGVTGWSMLPTVWPGDVVVIERTSHDSVNEGDIVLLGRDRRFVVHRVVRKGRASQLVTRGDAMPQADPPAGENELLGKVSAIVRSGKCIKPAKMLRLRERAVAALVQRSRFAARVVVGAHGFRRTYLN